MRKCGAAQVERPVQVHREVLVPLLVGHRRRVAHLVEARDVGQDVEAAELGDAVRDRLRARRGIGDVHRRVLAAGHVGEHFAIRSASRAIPNTEAPRSANSCAVEAPSPADAPVINATLPLSCVMARPSHGSPPGQAAARGRAGGTAANNARV